MLKIDLDNKRYIKRVEIKNIYGSRDISWSLHQDINILIGKNGSGKSTLLKLIDAYINNNQKVLKKFGNPTINIDYNENDTSLEAIFIDTFDSFYDNAQDKELHQDTQLDRRLKDLLSQFDKYQLVFKNRFEVSNKKNKSEIDRIHKDIEIGKIDEVVKIQEYKKNEQKIEEEIFKYIYRFRDIVNSMFQDSHKKINLKSTISQHPFTFFANDQEILPLELSSGEKQILVIFLTILLQEDKQFVLLLDEPENSLHSNWQINFIDNLRALSDTMQIIVATHNPLLMLNRESDEIGKISVDSDVVDTSGEGTKYMDVSATLLSYPQISSLVGKDMRDKIQRLYSLKMQNELSSEQTNELNQLEIELGKTVATNFIYDRHYLQFLKFIQENQDIDFDKLNEITDKEMDELLDEFKGLFDD